MPPHILELKAGVPVIIIRNVLHPHLVNGKMYVVKWVILRLLSLSRSPGDGPSATTFVLNPINFQFEFSDIKVLRGQFSVLLAFSPIVYKAQGTALSKLVIDLRTKLFAPAKQ